MALLDRIVYRIKAAAPWAYDLMALGNAAATLVLYRGRIRRALDAASISGTMHGEPAAIRPIDADALDALDALVASMPAEHLRFFRPHGLDRKSLRRVLKSRSILTYGLFRGDELVAYALLKLFATRRAYLGRVVSPALAGMGVGRFLARYLYWQSHELGFTVWGTMHQDNLASQKSHTALRPFTIVARLPKGYNLIQFSVTDEDAQPPELHIRKPP